MNLNTYRMCLNDLAGLSDQNHVIVHAPTIHDAIDAVRRQFGHCGSGLGIIPDREPRDEEHYIEVAP